ncbi:polymorphic toxin type 35 domain-containing protein [Paenibacillus kribbensis]|uniref:polymorphic toxin type 35 domain-containing protein n=1 Tax=Paenibacillus kribbensis TaxID=172713 RepID=UPI003F88822A
MGIWVHNTNCFTNISFKTDLWKRTERHIFSEEHIKDGIMALGKDKTSIMNNITNTIQSVYKSKIQVGSNEIHTTMNGYKATIRFYVDASGTIINVNAFKGISNRVIGNLIQ